MGNNSWMDSVFFSRHLVEQNVGNIIFVCYFLNIGLGPKKVNGLAICSKNQFGLLYLKPHRKVNATTLELSDTNLKKFKKPTNPFSNLDFLVKYGFPKIDFPWIVFPWIFHGGRADPRSAQAREARRPEKRVGMYFSYSHNTYQTNTTTTCVMF